MNGKDIKIIIRESLRISTRPEFLPHAEVLIFLKKS